jgi:indole-3-acetate monooxygenase
MSEQKTSRVSRPAVRNAGPVVNATELTPLIRDYADETERGRRMAAPVAEALRAARLFTMGLPTSLGGSETPIPEALRAIEQIAYADGATGWNVMIAFDTGMWAGYLRGAQSRELIASISEPILAGSINPPGRLNRTGSGYRLSGRWRFGSGCVQADAFIVGAMLYEDGALVTNSDGMAEMCQIVMAAADVTILDTWWVTGLRGTGSHDFMVENLLVPEGMVQPLQLGTSAETGPLYAFGLIPSFAVVKTAIALGIARHAVEALTELALTKTPSGQTSLMRERPAVQADLARAEACVRSARAFLHETVGEIWQSVVEGNPLTIGQRALLRLAAVDGVHRAIQAVDLMYNEAAGSAIFESSPLERCFRDVHVVPAHVVVQSSVYEVVGRVFLGMPPGTAIF